MHALQITSCLFATVVVTAYYAQCVFYHHMFLLVTVFSIWFHCTHHPWIALIDKVLAQTAFILVIWIDFPRLMHAKLWLTVFPSTVLLLWIWESLLLTPQQQDWKDPIHLCLHIVSILGLHCFLWQLDLL